MTNKQAATSGMVIRLPVTVTEVLDRHVQPSDIRQDCYRAGGDGFTPWYPKPAALIRQLNEAFGYAWSDRVLSHWLSPDQGQVLVHVRLTVYVQTESSPVSIDKDGLGQADLSRNPAGGCDNFGYDLKAAHTDGLRKAATKFGLSLHLYEKDESPFQGMQQLPPGDARAAAAAQPPVAGSQVAAPFQVEQMIQVLEKDCALPRAHWMQQLRIEDLKCVPVSLAAAIISHTHRIVHDHLQVAPDHAGGGLQSRDA